MPIKTQVNGRAIRSSRTLPSHAWVGKQRQLLTLRLRELEREAQLINQNRMRVEELLNSLPSINDHIKET